MSTGTAFGVRLAYWVETLAHVDEAVVGFIDSRFRIIHVAEEDAAANTELRRAVETSAALRGRRHLHPAAKEAWRSALDPSDEAFLSAFRALECLRRLYGEGETAQELAEAWAQMDQDLGADREPFALLREAAKAIRHGDRPASRTDEHPVNRARTRRAELLAYATDLVRTRMTRDLAS